MSMLVYQLIERLQELPLAATVKIERYNSTGADAVSLEDIADVVQTDTYIVVITLA